MQNNSTKNDELLESIILQCKQNLQKKNIFIDIFMNHFLNCDTISYAQNTNTSQKDIQNYFSGLFDYSIHILDTIQTYENYTTNFKKYSMDPIILKILEGKSIIGDERIEPENLDVIENIDEPPILQTQKAYNIKIGIDNVEEQSQSLEVGDPFETSIYNYINSFTGQDDKLKFQKFEIVNYITSI